MSLAWATIALILFLLPGIFFFIGLASYERLSREIIRSSVVSEVAMASAIAIGIHFVSIGALSAFGFRLSQFVEPLAEYSKISTDVFVQRASDRLMPTTLYLGGTTSNWILFRPSCCDKYCIWPVKAAGTPQMDLRHHRY